jgi:hypothetical protein
MAIVFLDNICVTLLQAITPASTILPLSAAAKSLLTAKLGATGYSYLTLATVTGTEIIKVTANSGEIVAERAQGGTVAVTGAKDACLCFKVNKLVMDEYVTPDYCTPTIVTDTPAWVEVIAPAGVSCEWKVNIKTAIIDKFAECCPDDACNNCTVADGVYENATLTIINGKVCGISNGKNIIYTGGGCCGCGTP